jgi:hypothetical protein
MDAILGVERVIAALAAFGCDDGVGQFELTHFQNRRSGPRLERRPRGEAEAKPEPSARQETAATQGTPISVVISSSHVRRGTDAPCRSCRNKPSATMPASCCGGIDRASLTAPPPQAGRIALDQFQQAVQRCGVP